MSVRLFPDFMVAVEVRDSMSLFTYFYDKTMKSIVSYEDMKDILKDVYICPETCIRHQTKYKNNGISNVFTGYGIIDWTVKDYKEYLNNNPKFFVEKKDNPKFFCLNLEDNAFVFEGEQSIGQYIKQVCIKLLNQGVYPPLLLKKYGII